MENFPGLGERLKKYRSAVGLSADNLVENVHNRFPNTGVSRQIIFNIEKGRREIRLDELFEIAATLNIHPTSLLYDKSKPLDVIESGTLKGYRPTDVELALSGWPDGSNRKQPDLDDLESTRLGMHLLLALDEFDDDMGDHEYLLAVSHYSYAGSFIKKLRDMEVNLPESVTQRFERDENIMNGLANKDPKVRKELEFWRTHRQ